MSSFWEGIPLSSMGDIWEATITEVGDQSPEYALKYGRYPFINGLFSGRESIGSGAKAIDKPISLDDTGNADWIHPYESIDPQTRDTTSRMSVDWAEVKTDFSISVEEMKACRGEAELYSLAEDKSQHATVDLANLVEARMWESYDGSSKKFLPVDYWLPSMASGQTSTDGGFYGGHATSDGSSIAGIAASTSGDNTTSITGGKDRWRSWQATYTADTYDEQLLETMRKAWYNIMFDTPVIAPGVKAHMDDPREIFTSTAVYEGLSEFCLQYDNRRTEIRMTDSGDLTFWGVPITRVPQLDSNARNPIYFINKNTFFVRVMEGLNLERTGPMNDRNQPNVYTTFTFLQGNVICVNRRCNACIAEAA